MCVLHYISIYDVFKFRMQIPMMWLHRTYSCTLRTYSYDFYDCYAHGKVAHILLSFQRKSPNVTMWKRSEREFISIYWYHYELHDVRLAREFSHRWETLIIIIIALISLCHRVRHRNYHVSLLVAESIYNISTNGMHGLIYWQRLFKSTLGHGQ